MQHQINKHFECLSLCLSGAKKLLTQNQKAQNNWNWCKFSWQV